MHTVCPHCGKKLKASSSHIGKTAKCPACHEKFTVTEPKTIKARATDKENEEKTLYITSPKMFRNRPVSFVICVLLIPAGGLGLLLLIVWFLKCKTTVLTITNRRTTQRVGILSKQTNEVRHADVRNLKVSQGFFQRMFKVGAIAVSSSGQSDFEIFSAGMPDPQRLANTIRHYQK